jgi:hypothetical protein
MLAGVLKLTAMPDTFAAGTTLKYTRSLQDYPANGGWTLTLALSGAIGLTKDADPSGPDFVITLIPAVSATLAASGLYRWEERVHNGVDVYSVGSGSVFVTPNVALVTDLRSMDERLLEAIDAVLVGKVVDDVIQYTIESRGLTRMDPERLWALRQKVARNVTRARAMGKPGRRRLVRFSGARSERWP